MKEKFEQIINELENQKNELHSFGLPLEDMNSWNIFEGSVSKLSSAIHDLKYVLKLFP